MITSGEKSFDHSGERVAPLTDPMPYLTKEKAGEMLNNYPKSQQIKGSKKPKPVEDIGLSE